MGTGAVGGGGALIEGDMGKECGGGFVDGESGMGGMGGFDIGDWKD